MQLIALLIIVIIVAVFAKPTDAKYFRVAVGSIFGIAYFGLWMFIRYYAQIFEWSDIAISINFVLLSVISGSVCFLPFIIRINQIGSLVLLFLFIITVFMLFTFEHEIKFSIADRAGYFEGENPFVKNENKNNESQLFEFKKGGYAIKTPNAWSQHQYKFTGFSYFLLVNNENKLAEFRPKCFHQLKLALPEIVLNVTTQSNSESIKHEKQCFRWLEGYSACLVRSKKPEKEVASRWRWFAVNPKLQHGIELDFVVYDNSAYVLKDIESIINSLRVTTLPQPRPVCFTSADWM